MSLRQHKTSKESDNRNLILPPSTAKDLFKLINNYNKLIPLRNNFQLLLLKQSLLLEELRVFSEIVILKFM